ncbi:MAG: serine/threonine-protein kinase RsbW [Solirubrobacterales bacterium]|nr:serine/threonine-protein kinase RsbW [Solirubrobacterales bacterium]
MPDKPTRDEVRLAVPATPEFLRLARVTATGLASRLGFTFDEVEDLRLAIDELCYALIGSKGRKGSVELRYVVLGEALEVEGVGDFEDAVGEITLSELSERILTALVDEHDLIPTDGHPRFRLLKRRSGT